MNQFNAQLAAAKRKQKITLITAAFIVIALAGSLAAFLIASKGTAFVIHPKEISAETQISVVSGTAIVFQDKLYSLTRDPEVRFQAPRYQPLTATVSSSLEGRSLEVTLKPLPARILATPEPANDQTKWYLNGKIESIEKELTQLVEPGSYSLKMDHPYFMPEEVTLNLGPDDEYLFEPKMTPHSAWLTVDSVPEGAYVSVDGLTIGQTPLDTQMRAGRYEIKLELNGYQTITEELEFTNRDDSVERNYRLKAEAGYLTVSADPRGGALLVNGRKLVVGREHELASGIQHELSYQLVGYRDFNTRFKLKPGQQKKLAIQLEPKIAKLEIRSRPQAQIFIDGKLAGNSPLAVDLPEKRYSISLRKEGYRTKDLKVSLSEISTTFVDETLLTEAKARLNEAEEEYVTAGGQTMKLFHPGGFTMGAPRSQPGQRANEFQRDILLSKPFYASQHEVTVGQYSQFAKPASGSAQNMPLTSVSWIDAARYTNWLSEKEGLTPVYEIRNGKLRKFNRSADGYRLLTEAEWEWLARKSNRKKQTLFTWGDKTVVPPKAGNIADESARGKVKTYVPNYTDGYSGLAPVGSFPKETSGLFDLTGNVSEWTHDFYSLTPPDPGAKIPGSHGPQCRAEPCDQGIQLEIRHPNNPQTGLSRGQQRRTRRCRFPRRPLSIWRQACSIIHSSHSGANWR